MIILLQLIAIGIFILIGLQIFNAIRRPELGRTDTKTLSSPSSHSPARDAAAALNELENVRADLKARYPLVFGMLGGYLNEHSMHEAGSIEAAVQEMIDDWIGRREQVAAEIVRILAENPDEDEIRAIIFAACDATFDEEGYKNWLTWLLGNFTDVS